MTGETLALVLDNISAWSVIVNVNDDVVVIRTVAVPSPTRGAKIHTESSQAGLALPTDTCG
jgi:hypothetical protein